MNALRGALAAIERRTRVAAAFFNEFDEHEPVTFNSDRRVLPQKPGSDNITVQLQVAIAASYTYFRDDSGTDLEMLERNAMRALCRCLYQDVLDDVGAIQQAVGDGKRRLALQLLSDLYMRLDGGYARGDSETPSR